MLSRATQGEVNPSEGKNELRQPPQATACQARGRSGLGYIQDRIQLRSMCWRCGYYAGLAWRFMCFVWFQGRAAKYTTLLKTRIWASLGGKPKTCFFYTHASIWTFQGIFTKSDKIAVWGEASYDANDRVTGVVFRNSDISREISAYIRTACRRGMKSLLTWS